MEKSGNMNFFRRLSFRHEIFFVLFLTTAFIQLITGILANGVNFSNDITIFKNLQNNPLASWKGESQYPQYSSALGIELLPPRLLTFLGLDLTASFKVYFLFISLIGVHILTSKNIFQADKLFKVFAYSLTIWVSFISILFIQEDVINFTLMTIVVYLLKANEQHKAIFVMSLSVVFGKLLFLFMLFPLLTYLYLKNTNRKLLIVSTLPGMTLFLLSILVTFSNDRPKFYSFSLSPVYSINSWSSFALLTSNEDNVRRISYACILVALMYVLYVSVRTDYSAEIPYILLSQLGLIILIFSYNVQPEYLFLLLPCALLNFKMHSFSIKLIVFLFPLAIIQNILFGLSNSLSEVNSADKNGVIEQMQRLLPDQVVESGHSIFATIFTITAIGALLSLSITSNAGRTSKMVIDSDNTNSKRESRKPS